MIKTKRVIAFILLITFLVSLIFVGKVASTDAKNNSNTKKKITMTVGQKKTIKLNKNVKIKWKSDNKKVVTVNKKGVIKAKKVGKAKVTAKLPNKKVQYTVKVNKTSENKTPEPTKRPPMTYAADVIIDHIEKIDDEYSYVYGVPNEEKTGAFGVAKIGSNGIDMLKIITKNSQIDRLKASAGDYVIYICSYGVEKKTEGNILLVYGNGYGLTYNKGSVPTKELTPTPTPIPTPYVNNGVDEWGIGGKYLGPEPGTVHIVFYDETSAETVAALLKDYEIEEIIDKTVHDQDYYAYRVVLTDKSIDTLNIVIDLLKENPQVSSVNTYAMWDPDVPWW